MNNDFDSSWQIHSYQHFILSEIEKSHYVVKSGNILNIKGKVKNNDLEISTCYVVVKLAHPYDHENILFNSDEDLSDNIKATLRIVDVKPKGRKEFSISIPVSETIENGVLDVQIEIWSPGRLYHKTAPLYTIALFDRTPFKSIVEIISRNEPSIANVFISYAWTSRKHKEWVNALSQELNRHNIEVLLDQKDLMPGQELTAFMERGVSKLPICIAVCSNSYTLKADNREDLPSGVGYEVSLLTNAIFRGRIPFIIIPVLRDNPKKTLPIFVGSKMYIDMDTQDWQGKPLMMLVNAIIEHAKKK